jgi:uncharacterized protein with PQ loop repeat
MLQIIVIVNEWNFRGIMYIQCNYSISLFLVYGIKQRNLSNVLIKDRKRLSNIIV